MHMSRASSLVPKVIYMFNCACVDTTGRGQFGIATAADIVPFRARIGKMLSGGSSTSASATHTFYTATHDPSSAPCRDMLTTKCFICFFDVAMDHPPQCKYYFCRRLLSGRDLYGAMPREGEEEVRGQTMIRKDKTARRRVARRPALRVGCAARVQALELYQAHGDSEHNMQLRYTCCLFIHGDPPGTTDNEAHGIAMTHRLA